MLVFLRAGLNQPEFRPRLGKTRVELQGSLDLATRGDEIVELPGYPAEKIVGARGGFRRAGGPFELGPGQLELTAVELRGAQCVTQYATGDVIENQPAVTVNPFGEGEAWYVSCKLVDEAWDRLFEELKLSGPGRPGLDVVDRGPWRFIINHTEKEEQVGHVIVPAGSWAVDKKQP